MIDVGYVTGSKAQAEPLIIGKDTVYVHTEIKKIVNDNNAFDSDLYRYREIQYEKDEYIKLIADKNANLEETVDSILTEVIPSMRGV